MERKLPAWLLNANQCPPRHFSFKWGSLRRQVKKRDLSLIPQNTVKGELRQQQRIRLNCSLPLGLLKKQKVLQKHI